MAGSRIRDIPDLTRMSDRITYIGTAFNKRPEQLLGRIRQMAKARVLPNLPIDINDRYERQIPEQITANSNPLYKNTIHLRSAVQSEREKYKQQAEETLSGNLSFLNDDVIFASGDSIRLDSESVTEKPIHWRIKCFGFEHLKWIWLGYEEQTNVPEEAVNAHKEWLREWVDTHEIARDVGYMRKDWTPHAVSLRICNWCRYDVWMGDHLNEDYKQTIRWFVWKNAAFLSDNVEYGVGGNHLIENGIALLMAGVYLENNAWMNQGREILQRAVDNQLLSDGGHFERSPMYHLIVCQRLLTATELLNAIGEYPEQIRDGAAECVSFVKRLSPPDERIPLLNDSVLGEALALPDCLDYAQRVLGQQECVLDSESTNSEVMSGTGYYWLGQGMNRLLAVAGDVTVPHLPAHAHAHPAQICLWAGGSRVITDTGVYEYAAGKRREQSRSVRGHNTIQVDEGEPLRFSGEFLCWGNISPDVEYTADDSRTEIEIKYNSNAVGQLKYQHKRTITHRAKQWTVCDYIEGIEKIAVSRLHIHPDYQTEIKDECIMICNESGDDILSIEPSGCDSVSTTRSPYYPEYGRELKRDMIELQRESDGRMNIEISYIE